MADANCPFRPQPSDWSEAFAAMPLDAAPTDAWARLSAALPTARVAAPGRSPAATARRPRMRVGLAAAASIALALPMAWWLGPSVDVPPQAPAASVPGRTVVSEPAARSGDQAVGATDAAGGPLEVAIRDSARRVGADVGDTRSVAAARSASIGAIPASRTEASPRTRPARKQRSALAVEAHASPAIADAGAPAASPSSPGATVPTTQDVDVVARLAQLHEESARLETLVAYARDDRMTSASAAVLTASLDDRIRLIDAALMQADLDASLRSSLWSERVGALHELASLEGTQRWMAAHGASLDAVARVD